MLHHFFYMMLRLTVCNFFSLLSAVDNKTSTRQEKPCTLYICIHKQLCRYLSDPPLHWTDMRWKWKCWRSANHLTGILREATGVKCSAVNPILGTRTDAQYFSLLCPGWVGHWTEKPLAATLCTTLMCFGMPKMDIGVRCGLRKGYKNVMYCVCIYRWHLCGMYASQNWMSL